ncbi:hypothetical protein HK104_006199 [Borealophlyctis nickersoniae]|nr:hypothetical protein HK104_006199 [Borealophlyctis nickersoniae]
MDRRLRKVVRADQSVLAAAVAALSRSELDVLRETLKEAARKDKPKSFDELTESDLEGILGLNLTNVQTEDKLLRPSVVLPPVEEFPACGPSEELKFTLRRLKRVWTRASDAGCRSFVDAIVCEALDVVNGWVDGDTGTGAATMAGKLRAYPQTLVEYRGVGRAVRGRVDYLIGHANSSVMIDPDMDGFMVVVASEVSWAPWNWIQAVGEGGAVLRKRRSELRRGPVFVVLTNAKMWQFFVIDEDGWVYSSGDPIYMDYSKDEDLELVLRWLRWFATAGADMSPGVALPDRFVHLRGSMSEQVRTCLSRDGSTPPPRTFDSAVSSVLSKDDDTEITVGNEESELSD